MELNRRMGASTWLAHTAYEYARMLLARGRGTRQAGRCSPRPPRWPSAIGMPRCWRESRALGTAALRRLGCPMGCLAREAQILRLVARGLSNREIGAALFISEHTAANHIRSILRKTGCANRTEAASYAHRHRLAPV